MAQRFCEICYEPLPLDVTDTSICDNCSETIELEVAKEQEIDESCDNSAAVEDSSQSITPAAMPIPETSNSPRNDVAPAVSDDLDPFGDLDLNRPAPTVIPNPDNIPGLDAPLPREAALPEVVEAIAAATKEPMPCECCGYVQKNLNPFRYPNQREQTLLCDKCYADEVALINHKDDPMQGKLVHPDEAERDEILSMDNEDRLLYNEEIEIAVAMTMEQIEARITLLERRLQRAKVQLKASKRTMLVRVENMKQEEKDKFYREANDRLQKRRARTSATAAPKGARQPRRTKAQQFRDAMSAAGMSAAWIEEQIKKMGLE